MSSPIDVNLFKPFEGMWVTTKSPGDTACAKIINDKLMIPYSRNGIKKPIGHYYDCKVMGTTLYCRYENFDSAVSGILFLKTSTNQTLKGGRWKKEQVPEYAYEDLSFWSESLPKMLPIVWAPIRLKETPEWAVKYFNDDWYLNREG